MRKTSGNKPAADPDVHLGVLVPRSLKLAIALAIERNSEKTASPFVRRALRQALPADLRAQLDAGKLTQRAA